MQAMNTILHQLSDRAVEVKESATIEPPLIKSDFGALLQQIPSFEPTPKSSKVADPAKTHGYAIIETAVRDEFNNLLVSDLTTNIRNKYI